MIGLGSRRQLIPGLLESTPDDDDDDGGGGAGVQANCIRSGSTREWKCHGNRVRLSARITLSRNGIYAYMRRYIELRSEMHALGILTTNKQRFSFYRATIPCGFFSFGRDIEPREAMKFVQIQQRDVS